MELLEETSVVRQGWRMEERQRVREDVRFALQRADDQPEEGDEGRRRRGDQHRHDDGAAHCHTRNRSSRQAHVVDNRLTASNDAPSNAETSTAPTASADARPKLR